MKSESFLPRPRSLFCVFCRSTSLSVSVELEPFTLTFGSLLLPIVTCRRLSQEAHFEVTSFTGSTFFRSRCLLYVNDRETFRCWSSTLSTVTRGKPEGASAG